ncbi:MAG: hypothetical protein AAF591_17145, partial [Verrucomicrobiota bacterium]
MKKIFLTVSASSVLLFGSAGAQDLGTLVANQGDCKAVASVVEASLAKAKKSQIYDLVSSAVQGKPACSCEIVTAAIVATGASSNKGKLTSILNGALDAAPDQANTIAECATAAAPGQSATIESVLQEKYGSTTDASYGGKGKSATLPTTLSRGSDGSDNLEGPGTWGDNLASSAWAPVYL